MSNWTERERKIFKVKLGNAEMRFDPMLCILQYNRAVRDMGGPTKLKQVWDDLFGNVPKLKIVQPDAEPLPAKTPEQELIDLHEHNLRDAECNQWLGDLGSRIIGQPLFSVENPDGLTLEEGKEVLYQFLEFSQKKENGAEKSPSQGQSGLAPSTDAANSDTPTS